MDGPVPGQAPNARSGWRARGYRVLRGSVERAVVDGGTMIPAALENAIYGLVSTPALYLADKHGIFRHLIDDGPADSAALAGRLDVDQDTTLRLLLVLGALGVLKIGMDGTFSV